MSSPDKHDLPVGPIVLYSLVSRRLFSSVASSDFFVSLLPFFEPFLSEHSGQILDIEALLSYARSTIFMPITRDVAELFIARMQKVDWVKREPGTEAGIIFRITYAEPASSKLERDIVETIAETIADIVLFAKRSFSKAIDPQATKLDDRLLNFLVRTASSKQKEIETAAPDDGDLSVEQADYIFARYIGHLSKDRPEKLQIINEISGVAILAEALAEVRSPALSATPKSSDLTVFLDAPLAMDYLGVSGREAKENADFTIERLKRAGITISVLRYACDEIKANLSAVLNAPPVQRHGPTHGAMLRGEISHEVCVMVMNNPEYALKKMLNIVVQTQTPQMFKNNANFCPDDAIADVVAAMPATTEPARRRDGESIGVIMRRRGGFATNDVYKAKFILLTTNGTVVQRASDRLRQRGLLSADRAIFGPALHQRTISGLIFANAGAAERMDISRNQVLGACARVAMLRPRVLEQMRKQMRELSTIEDRDVLEAIIMQPRGSEIVMDFTVGAGRTVSRNNVEELIDALKKGLTDDITRAHRDQMTVLEAKQNTAVAELHSEIGQRDEALSTRAGEVRDLRQANVRQEERFARMARSKALRVLKRLRRWEIGIIVLLLVVAVGVHLVPVIDKEGMFGKIATWITSILSALGFLALAVNRQFEYLDRLYQRIALRQVSRALTEDGLEEFIPLITIDYRAQSVGIAPAANAPHRAPADAPGRTAPADP